MTIKGSSETTREAFCFDLFYQYKPEHKKTIDARFLEWFIGFSEGDGSFNTWFDNGKKRANFTINQNDPKLLQWLRTELGFGTVRKVPKPEQGKKQGKKQGKTGKENLWRFEVGDKKGLFRLYCLFSGNLVLNKRHLKFQKWCSYLVFPTGFSQELSAQSSLRAKENQFSGHKWISLDNAWLCGFWEADGGFSAGGDFKDKRPHIIMKGYLTQRQEKEMLDEVAFLILNKEKKLSNLTNGTSDTKYNRLEFASIPAIQTLFAYFQKFPLKGEKHIAYGRWKRVFEAREKAKEERKQDKKPLSDKAIEKLDRLIKEINAKTPDQ